MQRRLAAILAADVVGYSRLMGRDEAATLTSLSRLRKDHIEPLIAAHHGRIVRHHADRQHMFDALHAAGLPGARPAIA